MTHWCAKVWHLRWHTQHHCYRQLSIQARPILWCYGRMRRGIEGHPHISVVLQNYGVIVSMTRWEKAFVPSILGQISSKNFESNLPEVTWKRKRECAYVASSKWVAFMTTSMSSLSSCSRSMICSTRTQSSTFKMGLKDWAKIELSSRASTLLTTPLQSWSHSPNTPHNPKIKSLAKTKVNERFARIRVTIITI